MIRKLKWIVIGVVVLLVAGVAVVHHNLNRIVKRAIETQGTASLTVPTELGGASLSIFGGKLTINELKIGSPQGFASPQMLTLGRGDVEVSYGQLREEPIRINTITLDKPVIVVEQAGGKFNFKELAGRIPQPPPDQKPIKLVIDKLAVKDATVIIKSGTIPGLGSNAKDISVPLPAFEVKDVGMGEGNKNGAALKDVAMIIIQEMVGRAKDSGAIEGALKDALGQGLKDVEAQMTAEIDKQVQGIDKQFKGTPLEGVGKDIGGEINKAIGGGSDKKEDAAKEQGDRAKKKKAEPKG